MIINANGRPVECAKIEKGLDYIKVYDDDGNIILEDTGISGFEGYSAEGGEIGIPPLTEVDKLKIRLQATEDALLFMMDFGGR